MFSEESFEWSEPVEMDESSDRSDKPDSEMVDLLTSTPKPQRHRGRKRG